MTDFWKDSQPLEDRLAEVERVLAETINDPGYPLAKDTASLVLSGGKMLRPALVLIGAGFGKAGRDEPARAEALGGGAERGFQGRERSPARGKPRKADKIVNMAAAIELLHAATLIHDDILDRAEVRRGIPTLHTRFGTTNAILAGDWLFSRSFRLVADSSDITSARILARFVGAVCSAEIRQDLGKFSFSTSRRGYLRTIAGKTAALFSLSLHVGASEAKASPLVVQRLRRAGYDIGMAFQIIDDILDYESDDKTLRKPVGNDIREGLCTLPLIIAMESDPEIFRPLIGGERVDDASLARIVKLVVESGALEKARGVARSFTARARREIARLPAREARGELETLVDRLLERRY